MLALHLESPLRRARRRDALDVDRRASSALALTEALALIDQAHRRAAACRPTWRTRCACSGTATHVVPVDQRCLDRAAQLLREQPLRLADALHLAAADRLPRPITFVTFDPAQIPVALSLGFDVVSN